MSDPIFPFDVWTQQITQASVPANRNALRSQILQSTLKSLTEATQPAAPEDGDVYSLPAGATGSAWDAFETNDLVIYRDGAWYAFAPVLGLVVAGPDGDVVFTEAGWAPYSSSGGATVFTQLGDVPASYAGQEGRMVAVNATGDGLVFVEGAPGGSEAFTDLTDTPADYTGQEGKLVAVNGAGDGLEFVDAPEPGGASEFTQLTDTPASYVGAAGMVVVVNAEEDGLDFVELPAPGGATAFTNLTDTPADYTGQAGRKVVVNATEDGLEFVPDGSGSDVDWVKISTDFTGPTEATAGADQSMAIGPGAETVPGVAASAVPTSSGSYGNGTGYLFFPTGPVPFTAGSTVVLSGFPSGGLTTYGNYGLDSSEDPTTVILDRSNHFRVGTVVTVANAANPEIEGSFPIFAMSPSRPQVITLGGGFSATDEDLVGATFTGLEPDVNGPYEVLKAYYQQIILAGFNYVSFPLPSEALVSSVVEGKAVAIGPQAVASADRAVALGYGTTNSRAGSVSIGGRVLGGLLSPILDDDAVTLAYMRNNRPTVEETMSAGGTITDTPGETNFSQMMYQQNDTAGFYDGKLVVFDPATGAVSSWRLSFNGWVDPAGQMTISSFELDPVSVDPNHSGLEFEAVVNTSSPNYWKLTYVNAAGPVKFSATIKRTVAYNF